MNPIQHTADIKVKAEKIEQAAGMVQLKDRGLIFKDVGVRKALASHRLFRQFRSDPDSENGLIEPNKAANSFKSVKAKFEDENNKEESRDNTPTGPKN